MKPRLSLVFTFYNEEKNCSKVIPPLKEELTRAGIPFEMVLVNNGSLDRTADLLKKMADEDHRLKVAHVAVNVGYGRGILEGLQHATGDYIGYLSGDGQVSSVDVLKAAEWLGKPNIDLVKVKRVVREDGLLRLFVSRCYNTFMRLLYRCPSDDLNGTPKIFRRELLPVFDLHSKDWFIDPEIMIKAKKMGLKIHEIPIVFTPRKEGKSSVHIGTIFEFLKNALLYRLRKEYRLWKKQKLSSWRAV